MYYAGLFMKTLRIAIILVLVIFILYFFFKKRNPLNLKYCAKRWLRFLPVILVATLLGGTLEVIYLKIKEVQNVSCKVGYNFPEASTGRTLNGSRLDVTEIIGDEILQEVLDTGNFGDLSINDLKDTLSIENFNSIDEVSPEQQYISTEYTLNYEGNSITKNIDGKNLLTAITDAYREYFVNTYGRKTNILDADFSQIDDMDYPDIAEYLTFELDNIINYMAECKNSAPTFISKETQESFGSLEKKAENYKNTALEKYEAYFLQYGISKDKDDYISRLEHENQLLETNYMKSNSAYQIYVETINKYDGEIIRSVLVPTRDESGEFYQSRTKIGTDLFAEDANLYLTESSTIKLEIEDNKLIIKSLENGNPTEENFDKADSMVEEMISEIEALSDSAKLTVEEYVADRVKNYMNVSFGTDKYLTLSEIVKTFIYGAMIFALVSILIMISDTELKKKRR